LYIVLITSTWWNEEKYLFPVILTK